MLDPIFATVIIEATIMVLVLGIVIIIVLRRNPRRKEIECKMSLPGHSANFEELQTVVQELQLQKRDLTRTLLQYERKPSRRMGLTLLLLGANALVGSTVFTSPILASIGLGLTFWGALLLFIRPVRYVKSDLLDATIVSSLATIDRIIEDLNYQGDAVYLPPRHLKELEQGILFISAQKGTAVPTIDKLTQEKVFVNPHGMCITPLGQGLVNLFEEKLGTNLFKTDLDFLQTNLPRLLIDDLELLKDIKINIHSNMVQVRMTRSVYSNLCGEVKKLTNICTRLGCPLCSAIACALARVTGRPVTIEKNEFHPDKTIETWYRLMEG